MVNENKTEIPADLMEKQIKSTMPYYLCGAAWLLCALIFPIYKFGGLLATAVIGAAVFFISSKIIPKKTILVPVTAAAFFTGDAELDAALNKARSDLAALRGVNARIADAGLSADIVRMEKAGASILNEVSAHPEKARKIRRFCTYYLPTATKVLNTYADAAQSGSKGENANALQQDIRTNATVIAEAFEKQLDNLFSADVLDVSTDLETMKVVQQMDGDAKNGVPAGATVQHATATLKNDVNATEDSADAALENMQQPTVGDASLDLNADVKPTLTLDGAEEPKQ